MRRALVLGSLALLAACASSPEPRRPATKVEAPGEQNNFGPHPWGEFTSKRFHLTVPLPDGRAWRIDDRSTSFLVAKHLETGSEVLVRAWQEGDRTNRATCEERARSLAKIPERDGAQLVNGPNELAVPPEFDTVYEVWLDAPDKPGEPIDAFLLAFGGDLHRCFAYVFTTRASGAGAARAVSDRLATMAAESLAKIRVTNDLAPNLREKLDAPADAPP